MDYKEVLRDKLTSLFGHDDYKSQEQKKVTEAIFQGIFTDERDIFIDLPSGFGKSLCFQLPVLASDNSFAIIITPTIALAKIQVDYLKSKNISAFFWNAYSSKIIKNKIKNLTCSSEPKIKFLYTTPEQCRSLHFQVLLAQVDESISYYFVIDEAHCMTPWSHDFRDCYKNLYDIRKLYSHVPIVAVSSTITKKIKDDIFKILSLRNPWVFSMPVFRSNLIYDVQFSDFIQNPLLDLKNFIDQALQSNSKAIKKENKGCGIIFCKKENLKELYENLSSIGIQTLIFNRSQDKESLKVLQLWSSGECQIIIATGDFGLGISKPSVRFVVHWGIPKSIAHYYQESGRAGHDGYLSYSRVYFSYKEIKDLLTYVEKELFLSDYHIIYQPTQTILFAQVVQSFTQLICRHSVFSSYFGKNQLKCLNKCDVCLNKNVIAQRITSLLKHETISNNDQQTLVKKTSFKSQNMKDDRKMITDANLTKISKKNSRAISKPCIRALNIRKVSASEEMDKIMKILYL